MTLNKLETTIKGNLDNPKMHSFLERFIGEDYSKSKESLHNNLESTYKQMPAGELTKFEKELLDIIK